jgi:hypothetical protein
MEWLVVLASLLRTPIADTILSEAYNAIKKRIKRKPPSKPKPPKRIGML